MRLPSKTEVPRGALATPETVPTGEGDGRKSGSFPDKGSRQRSFEDV